MPLDLNQLAPVAIWRYPYHPVDGSSCPSWSERRDDWIPGVTPEAHTALRTETFTALVEELRAAREVARCAAALVALDDSLPPCSDGPTCEACQLTNALRAALSGGAS